MQCHDPSRKHCQHRKLFNQCTNPKFQRYLTPDEILGLTTAGVVILVSIIVLTNAFFTVKHLIGEKNHAPDSSIMLNANSTNSTRKAD